VSGGFEDLDPSTATGQDGTANDGRPPIELRTVDSELTRTARPITFIKCDVEGHEAEALEGATDIIERDRPALCVEVTGDPDATGSSSHRIVSSLGRQGYEPFWLDAGHLVRRRAGDRSVNYFFLTDAHRTRLAARGLLAA